MKINNLITAKAVFIASLAFSATAVLAERPSGDPTCSFTGGAYYSSNNTLYLESFADESAEVAFDQTAADCVNGSNPSTNPTIVVQRDTPLKSNSTIVLPFQADLETECVKVYLIDNFNNASGTWEAVGFSAKGDVGAFTPYIMVADTKTEGCEAITEIKFTAKSRHIEPMPSGMPLNTGLYNGETHNTDFVLRGTFKYIKWDRDKEEFSGIYGYAAKDKGAVSGGQFVKVGSGAYLPPLRAYLEYVGHNDALLRKSSDKVEDFELPETINVRLIDGDSTLSVGKLNTFTGEIQMDSRRYDLNGRAINGMPANHGVYVGKQKVVR